MAYRVLKPNDMPQVERRCPECEGDVMMKSTGTLLHYGGTGSWGIEFRCPNCDEFFPTFVPEYSKLLEILTAGVDPAKLEWRPLSKNLVMALRVLAPTRMPVLLRRCPECDGIIPGGLMRSTGRILYAEGTGKYVIEFHCPYDGALFFSPWTPEQRKLIEDQTKGVDPMRLPARGGYPKVLYYIQRGGPGETRAVYRIRNPFEGQSESAFWENGSWHEDYETRRRWVRGFGPGVDEVTEEEALEAAGKLENERLRKS